MHLAENILLHIAGALSLIGNAVTFSSYVLFPELRSTSMIFAIWLAIGSSILILATLLQPGYHIHNSLCQIGGTLNTYGTLISVFTTVVVAHCMKLLFINNSENSMGYRLKV
jgi:hypothetical protein